MESHDKHAGHNGHQKVIQKEDVHNGHNKVSDKADVHHHPPKADEHQGHDKHEGHSIMDFKRRFWISTILTIPVLFTSHMFLELFGIAGVFHFEGSAYVNFVISTIIFFYGGYPFLKGLKDEFKHSAPGMMTLIALAITISYTYSTAVVFGLPGDIFFWELATLIDIMLLGHWIEMRSVMGASKALEEIIKLLPEDAHKLNEDGSVTEISLKDLTHHDKILIKPGEKIPADGIVIEGTTSVNESMITGESNPVHKTKGDGVTGGSVNGEGSIKIEVEKTGDESFLSQVVKMVRDAQANKSSTQNLADKAAFWLTIIAVVSGAITLFFWLLIAGSDFHFALTRTVTVMVITCPHALGVAIPLVVAVSTALSAKNGLLIKNRNAFEMARNIQAVVFDKTGTLTKGEFGVTEIISFNSEYPDSEILKYAATVESESEHPIAASIVKAGKDTYKLNDFISIPGIGAEGTVNGKRIKVVSPRYLRENNIELKEKDKIGALHSQGKTVVYVIIENELQGAIALADIIREESVEAIQMLQKMGIKTIMLTGDNKDAAKWVADQIKVDQYIAEALPGTKSERIKEIQKQGLIVAMAGDGVNDAPSLAQADVGIALGAGTDVAIETADILLVRNNPKDVATLIKFAKKTYAKMIQNLIWATGYNIIAIPLAAGVLYSYGILLSPALGAVLMSVSTVIVAINAKLLKLD